MPDERAPRLTLAMRQPVRQPARSGWPVLTRLRPAATAGHIEDISSRTGAPAREHGLAG